VGVLLAPAGWEVEIGPAITPDCMWAC